MTRSNPAVDWTSLMLDASRLWADASIVVALRSWRMMAGGALANQEAKRMFSEKADAGLELIGVLASGRLRSPEAATRDALRIYGKRVRRNRKRLG